MTRVNRAKKSLSAQVTEALRDEIERGIYAPGDKLPTEPDLVARFGHSRTVIREAIAALRADGYVESRHGVGVFVIERTAPKSSLHLLTQINARISDIIEELELRAAVEIEAAALAAQRCSPAQEAEIQAQLEDFERRQTAGESTAEADFAFHMAIARATNNARFEEFLAHLGRRTIPRAKLRDIDPDTVLRHNRDAQLNAEHRAVAEAIYARDPEAAREAMRRHLGGSLKRYRVLTQPAGAK